MNFEQIRYIIEVAEQGTIASASKKLHVSHSAVSQAIANLESELGLVIFERSRSGSQCTSKGKEVLKLAYEIMSKYNELKDLSEQSKTIEGELKISAATIYFSTFLPEVIYAFKRDYPQIKIEIQENETHNIIKSLNNHHFDIGLILGNDATYKEIPTRLQTRRLLQSKIMVCVSKQSPLAYNQVVLPEELLQQPLVIRNEELSQIFWDTLFSHYGPGNIVFHSNNHDVVKNLIANNLATGIYTDFWIKNDPLVLSGEIIPIPYYDSNFVESYLISLLPKNKHQSFITREFLKYLDSSLNQRLLL